jgi:hypothetical protein
MTEDERREQARQLIREAFAERQALTETKLIEHDPSDQHVTALHRTALHATTQQLIEGTVIDQDAAETLASERAGMGSGMGTAEAPVANSLESQDE